MQNHSGRTRASLALVLALLVASTSVGIAGQARADGSDDPTPTPIPTVSATASVVADNDQDDSSSDQSQADAAADKAAAAKAAAEKAAAEKAAAEAKKAAEAKAAAEAAAAKKAAADKAAAEKVAAAKKAAAAEKVAAAKAATAEDATPSIHLDISVDQPNGVVFFDVTNDGDVTLTGCKMSVSGDASKTYGTNITLVSGGHWSATIENLFRGSYVGHVDCNEATASQSFEITGAQPTTSPSPTPTVTPTPDPTPTVTTTPTPTVDPTPTVTVNPTPTVTQPNPTPTETASPPAKPAQPGLVATCGACANPSKADGSVKVTVTNTADDTHATVVYTVSVGAVSKTVTIQDGKSAALEFTGLAAGEHKVTVKGDDDTQVETKVTVKDCKPAPTPKKVTLKLQVDKYSTKTRHLRSKAAGYDNDGLLKKGEDRAHYGHSTWEIVTVTGTAQTTKSEWIAKINRATKRVPDLKSTRHWTTVAIKKAKAKSITQAWVISGDGKPTAWYAGHTRAGAAQRHFASNR